MSKQYGVMIADPPWQYSNGGNGAARNHYPTMTLDAICALPVASLASPDSVLLLWATWPMLADAMHVIGAWGFTYKTGFPWVKLAQAPRADLWGDVEYYPAWGTGFWVRSCSEPILIATRGHASPPDTSWLGMLSPRFKHSRKPDNLYQYAESLPGPRLELFARRSRAGWDSWGNEVKGSVELGLAI